MGRLAWVASAFLLVWLMGRWLRFRQTRKLRAGAHFSAHGQASLIVVVSSRCSICPAQKRIVLKLRERYPASLLRVVTLDAEMEPAQAREFAVMTVPATLILDPDGTAVHINNGFTRFDVLARQIDNQLKRHLNEVG
jgi:hypothetical protein